MYVIDGGSLLQEIPWQWNGTIKTICEQFYNYLQQKYMNANVVFDGYLNGSWTKDIAHYRRKVAIIRTHVKFTYNTPFFEQRIIPKKFPQHTEIHKPTRRNPS